MGPVRVASIRHPRSSMTVSLCCVFACLVCFIVLLRKSAIGGGASYVHRRALLEIDPSLVLANPSSLGSVAGLVASTLCNGLFISNRTLPSLLSGEGCLLGCALLPTLVTSRTLNYTIDQRLGSVTATATVGQIVVNATAPSNASQPFSCLVETSAQVGPVTRPVYLDDGLPWRRSDWPEALNGTSTAILGVDYGQLAAAINPYFDRPDLGNSTANATGMRAVVVVHQGMIVAERYAETLGFFNSTPLLGWSLGKSLTAALTGMRIADGAINLTDMVSPSSWSPAEVTARNITVEDLLQQTSGIQWTEVYLPGTDATEITFGLAQNDSEAFVAKHPQAVPAGTQSDYSTGNVQLLQGQLRRSFAGNDTAYWSYPFNRLFKPLGARSFSLGTDGVGTFLASSSFFATARDWARLGQLYLQDGVWNGTTILPPGWVNFTRTPSEASADFDCGPVSRVVGNCGPYGALWWLRPFRNVANDTYAAIGFEGQYIVLIPSQDLVIVALGWAVDDSMDDRYAGALVRNVSAAMSPRGTVLDARGV